jgi:predicted dehydrogenase
MMHKTLMFGAGGFARRWIEAFLQPFVGHHLELVGLVDSDPRILTEMAEFLGLTTTFDSIDAAFEAVERGDIQPDACLVVLPPWRHLEVIEKAARLGLHVLCEKPISDQWEECLAARQAAHRAGIKLHIVQNYRYEPNMVQAKRILDEGELGRINYILARFSDNYRVRGSWGSGFAHGIPHALMVEGGVHHLDQLRNLSGSDYLTLSGSDWRPDFAAQSFDGECCALFMGVMKNGVRVAYEGNLVGAGTKNSWRHELYRVECDGGALVAAEGKLFLCEGSEPKEIEITPPRYIGHQGVINDFLNWLKNDRLPPTNIDDNIKTAAALFAAIQASESGRALHIDDLLG